MRLLIPLFSPATGTWGGLTRVVAVAGAAKNAGHRVAFCASGQMADSLRQHAYPVYDTPPTTMLGLPASISRRIERRSQRVSLPVRQGKSVGNIWAVLMLSGLARAGYLHRLVSAELEIARDFQADSLFTDLDPGAFLLHAIRGLPIASAYANIMQAGQESLPWTLMQRASSAFLKSYGLQPRTPEELFFGPEILKIIPSIPELDGADPQRADVRYVGQLLGPVQPPQPGDPRPEPGRRYVFVYTGTGSISLDRLKEVLPQVFPQDSPVTCLVGAQSIERPQRLGGVELRPYVPAEAFLPFCDWTICHGGQNTMIQSLQNGTPLIVFPGPIFERRYNAQKVQEAGAGVMGELDDFTMEWLRSVMARQASLASRAAMLGERIRSFGGADAAVQAIEEHSKTDSSIVRL